VADRGVALVVAVDRRLIHPSSEGRMRILVVEDDKKVASFLEKGLREDGYAVDVAHDGVDGSMKAHVYEYDLAIIDMQMAHDRVLWELESFQVTSGTGVIATATVVVRDTAGEKRMEAATGDGPIDAIYSAIQKLTGVTVELEDYETHAITGGKDAQGEVVVQLRHGDRKVRGRGLSTDVVEAAARAYLSAINRIKTSEARSVKATTMQDAETP